MSFIIRSDIRRAVLSRVFLAGMLGMIAIIASASITSILKIFANGSPPAGYHTQLILDALASDNVLLAAPIICALPFTTAFVEDMQSGFIKQFLPRSGVNFYICGKLVACAISGGLVLSGGIMLAYLLASAVFLPLEMPFQLAFGPVFPLLLGKVGIFFLSGMFWSLLGFTLAALTKSRYIAYASPFILYYVLIILYERYFGTFYYFYPKEWLNPSHFWLPGNWGLMLFLLILTGILGLAFTIFARRQLYA
jgi:hypothetical protein